jgi:hypothetical protein
MVINSRKWKGCITTIYTQQNTVVILRLLNDNFWTQTLHKTRVSTVIILRTFFFVIDIFQSKKNRNEKKTNCRCIYLSKIKLKKRKNWRVISINYNVPSNWRKACLLLLTFYENLKINIWFWMMYWPINISIMMYFIFLMLKGYISR